MSKLRSLQLALAAAAALSLVPGMSLLDASAHMMKKKHHHHHHHMVMAPAAMANPLDPYLCGAGGVIGSAYECGK